MARRPLLVDLDGTLWDSRPWYAQVLGRLCGAQAWELEDRLASGTSVVELARMRNLSNGRFAGEAERSIASLSFYDGALDALEELVGRGTPIGVVTNLPGWLVGPMLEATELDEYFDVVVTPVRGLPSKPRPHGVLKALREMGSEPGPEIWFVGDSAADAQAAARAGVSFAWASYGYDDEAPTGAERELGSFGEVLEL